MKFLLTAVACLALCSNAFSQHLVVTAEGHHGSPAPKVTKDEVTVEIDKRPVRLEAWVPLVGDQANVELYIVIDDGEDSDVSLQYPSIKDFINQQPPSTRFGLAYLRNGSALIAAPMTADRDAVTKALRLPLGQPGISASPYMGLSDLVKKWPAADARGEILLITSGLDPYYSTPDPQDPYLMKAISDAQTGGILVHSIYNAGAGHFGHSYSRTNWGQNYLSELGDETGGEAYWQGFGNAVSFVPFLKDLTECLQNQYLLTVATDAARKPGMQPVRVTTSVSGVSLVAASKIHISR